MENASRMHYTTRQRKIKHIIVFKTCIVVTILLLVSSTREIWKIWCHKSSIDHLRCTLIEVLFFSTTIETVKTIEYVLNSQEEDESNDVSIVFTVVVID